MVEISEDDFNMPVLYTVAGCCFIFGVVSAYVIYQDTQEEREAVRKMKRKRDGMVRTDFDKMAKQGVVTKKRQNHNAPITGGLVLEEPPPQYEGPEYMNNVNHVSNNIDSRSGLINVNSFNNFSGLNNVSSPQGYPTKEDLHLNLYDDEGRDILPPAYAAGLFAGIPEDQPLNIGRRTDAPRYENYDPCSKPTQKRKPKKKATLLIPVEKAPDFDDYATERSKKSSVNLWSSDTSNYRFSPPNQPSTPTRKNLPTSVLKEDRNYIKHGYANRTGPRLPQHRGKNMADF